MVAGEDVGDPLVPGGAGRGDHGRLQQEGQQRLLGVQPVLGLVPDDRLRPVDDRRRRSPGRGRRAGSAARSRRPPRGAMAASSTAYGANGSAVPARVAFSASWPIETQVSVATTSAPLTAVGGVRGDQRPTRRAPWPAPRPGRRPPGRAGGSPGAPMRTCMPARAHAQQVGVRHVVGAVAEVGQAQARRARPLCSVTVIRSARIWHGWNSSVRALTTGTRAGRGHLLDPVLAEGAPDDRRALAVEHAGGVGDRLAAAELAGRAVDDQGVAAQLGDADGEGHPRAGRRLVEDDGDGARSGERPGRRTGRP